jgi:FtsP/CotA-like multicopper oxidase with cupredoxin domain
VDRRRFLALMGSSAVTAACGSGSEGGMHAGSTAGANAVAGNLGGGLPANTTPVLSEGLPLRPLVRLANASSTPGLVEIALTASPVDIELVPGAHTTFWAFNGSVPGPLIEAREGDRVRVSFTNALAAQESTVHWHGMPVPSSEDGNPLDPVAAGASRVYEFSLPTGCAASYWYHPHPHRVTHEQVFRGLAGVFLVKPAVDPLPPGLIDTPLVISDLRLDSSYRIAPDSALDYAFGREGDVLLVNGGRRPVLTAAPGGMHRLRLFNATNARYLRLAIDGVPLTLIGTDGGLFETPVAGLPEVLLAPGERAEVIVAFSADTTLRNLPYDRGSMMMGRGGITRASEAILSVTLNGAAAVPVALPRQLRAVEPLPTPTVVRQLVLGPHMAMGGLTGMTMGAFTINGRSFDMQRVDLSARVGEVELWEIVNPTGMDHPFHLHGTQFQVVERVRAGVVRAEPFLAWKDTVNVARSEAVRFRVRQDLPGLRMYHCHILEHEDQGMMGVLRVS